ncbi:hypothetical protein Tco_1342879, partial [Tanacetum coccineum]
LLILVFGYGADCPSLVNLHFVDLVSFS